MLFIHHNEADVFMRFGQQGMGAYKNITVAFCVASYQTNRYSVRGKKFRNCFKMLFGQNFGRRLFGLVRVPRRCSHR